uniref:Uncharacterized protein n=1 Tax=Rhizophora mucronata TaxID=61149 RepID=A0A2P2NZ37_RHIMU
MTSNIINQQGSNSTSIVCTCDGTVPFLAGGVPYLSLDELITDSYVPVSEFHPNSWLRI